MATLCAIALAASLSSCSGPPATASGGHGATPKAGGPATAEKPNIVFVLTDDLSRNLVRYMPHVRQLQEDGTNFTNFYVTDSLCCPSRTSILTGQYPHDTGVYTNNGDDGGYTAFLRNGDQKKSFGSVLQAAGYRTGFMGKYLNGYQPTSKTDPTGSAAPPGWNEWDVAGDGYPEYNYDLNENGHAVHYGHAPKDYLTDVLSSKATSFVDAAAKSKQPFMLEVATFAPHAPSTPAPQDANKFPSLAAPRTAAYDKPSTPTPQWQKVLTPLTPKEKQGINQKFRLRVRSIQAVDRMIGSLEDELKAKGLADDTYFVFSSDNGFHMGEHRLRPGKQTPYDTDIRVPLVVTGPGVPRGKNVSALAENIDLSPTFQDLAGLKPPSTVDGRSLTALLRGEQPDDWRQAVLIEHHHPKTKQGDPDAAPKDAGDPPSYEAIRTADELYVEYADGEREYYETDSDTAELKNKVRSLSSAQSAALHKTLAALEQCHGTASCGSAAHLQK